MSTCQATPEHVLDLRCRIEPATDGFATALVADEVTGSWANDPR